MGLKKHWVMKSRAAVRGPQLLGPGGGSRTKAWGETSLG